MGLLTKAIGIHEVTQLFDKKKSEDWLDPTDLVQTQQNISSVGNETINFNESEAIGKLISFIQNSTPNLHTPVKIFSILEEIFEISKGAFLLLDHVHQQFTPLVSKGYDTTTQSRLRIPVETINDIFAQANEVVFLGKEEIDFCKPFFSLRELSLLEDICFYPFWYHESDVIAVLLVSESSIIFSKRTDLFDTFDNAFSQISHLIYSSREKFVKLITNKTVKSNENIFQEIDAAMSSAENSDATLFFLTVSVAPILEELKKTSENIDLFQIQNDILNILTTMMPDNEHIYLINYGTLFIILNGRYHINEQLFFHQIQSAMRNIFSTVENIDFKDFIFFKYPEDVSNAQEVIQKIFY